MSTIQFSSNYINEERSFLTGEEIKIPLSQCLYGTDFRGIQEAIKNLYPKVYENLEQWSVYRDNSSILLKRHACKVTGSKFGEENEVELFNSKEKPPQPSPRGRTCKDIPFTVIVHHNQALDVWDKAKKEGKIQAGGTLIHFDTHADLVKTEAEDESIASYINTAIKDQTFAEIYWVFPAWEREQGFFSPKNLGGGHNFWEAQTDYTFYVQNGEILFDQNRLDSSSHYTTVKFHKVTADQLPTFKGKTNISLDVDGDYFSNAGREDGITANYNLSYPELSAALYDFERIMAEKEITPSIITLSRSPDYTPEEDLPIIEKFFHKLYGDIDYIPNLAVNFKHGDMNYQDVGLVLAAQNILTPGNQLSKNYYRKLCGQLTARGFSDVANLLETYIHKPSKKNGEALNQAVHSSLTLLSYRRE